MRLIIRHATTYRFATPASAVIQTLRLAPRSHDGQHIVRWRLDVDRNCRLRSAEDAFGNQTHVFAVDGPLDELIVLVEGEVDTQDVNGFVRGAIERFPPALYLRGTPLTAPDGEIAAFAEGIAAKAPDVLSRLHGILDTLHEEMECDRGQADVATPAAEAFRLKRGVCQDLAHVFIVAARHLGIPARYVGGYFRSADGAAQDPGAAHSGAAQDSGHRQDSGHGWAEAYVPELGWVGFDPANGVCPVESHVRVAIGLDYLGAAPVRGSRYGGSGETLSVSVVVEDARETPSHRRN